MSEVKPIERAKLNFDLDDDDAPVVAPLPREVVTQKIEEVSQKSGFVTKSPKTGGQPVGAVSVPDAMPSSRNGRKRASTGRTMPFNTRMRPERYDEICQLSDRFTAEEGRPVGMAEVLERALDALQAKLKG